MRSRKELPPIVTSATGVIAAAVVTLALAVALGSLFSGCAGSTGGSITSSAEATTSTALATTSTVAETTSTTVSKVAWGDTGKWQGISVTAASAQNDYSPALVGEGNKVVYCMVTLANNGSEPFDYNGLDFILLDTAHQEYNNYGLASTPDLGEGTLAVGQSVSGAVAFELPQAASASSLEWQPHSASGPQLIWGEP